MNSSQLIEKLFSTVISNVNSFIENDLVVVVSGMLSIIFIVFAGGKLVEFFNMSAEEKNARSAFSKYRDNRDTWKAPLYRKEWFSALREYEDYEKGE